MTRPRFCLLLLIALLAALAVPSATAQEPPPLVDVALDPGHSYADVGAVGAGVGEYVWTLDIAQRTRVYLESAGLTVRLTREDHAPLTAMRHPDSTERTRLEQEARIAAAMPARVYVSLHLNGGPASLRGTETYYNADRGPDDADLRLARSIQRGVVDALAEYGYATVDRGARSDLLAGKPYGHFFSLRGPAPSALLEALFLSHPFEASLVADDAAREAIARGCAQGILEYLAGAAD